jgi:hypothetical protein
VAADGSNPSGKIAAALTEEAARAAIAPWYSLFNVASRGGVQAIEERILTEGYEFCAFHMENWLSAIGQLRAK